MQALVECGCPNTLSRVVHPAKRLRAFLQLDECKACSACKLRWSCENANITVNCGHGVRGEDVLQILLTYATDPTITSGEYPVSAKVQLSARKLLCKLIELDDTEMKLSHSDSAIDPSSQRSSSETLVRQVWECAEQRQKIAKFSLRIGGSVSMDTSHLKTALEDKSKETVEQAGLAVEKKDYTVEVKLNNCKPNTLRGLSDLPVDREVKQALEFVENDACNSNPEIAKGDWLCRSCNFINFARNAHCLKCKAEGPKTVDHGGFKMESGDWACGKCEFVNFSRNKECFRCHEVRPHMDLLPGEWLCPSCLYLNFNRNKACRICNCGRPRKVRHIWSQNYEDNEYDGDDNGLDLKYDEDDDIMPLEFEGKFVSQHDGDRSQ